MVSSGADQWHAIHWDSEAAIQGGGSGCQGKHFAGVDRLQALGLLNSSKGCVVMGRRGSIPEVGETDLG